MRDYHNLYQVGGCLPLNAPSYVPRIADSLLLESLRNKKLSYILNSRQMGKSSLCVRVSQILEQDRVRCASIDLSGIGTQNLSPEQWYYSVLSSLVRNFELRFNLRDWWRSQPDLSFSSRMQLFFESILQQQIHTDIVIFIDEIDTVLSLPFSVDDFFALIRMMANASTLDQSDHQLTFVLIGVATPSQLINKPQQTPFNIGQAIPVEGFTWQEAKPLLKGLAPITTVSHEILRRILDWTGGQPFLTQKLCSLARSTILHTEAELEWESMDVSEWVNNLVSQQVINNWEFNDHPEHFKTICSRLQYHSQRGGRLLDLCLQIHQHTSIPIEGYLEDPEILLSGIIRQRGHTLRFANKIYPQIFTQNWLQEELDKIRPYSHAIAAWLNSHCTDESRLLRGEALQEALSWANPRKISDQDHHYLAESQRLERSEEKLAHELSQAKAVEAQLQSTQVLARKQKQLLLATSTGLLVAIFLGVTALFNTHLATRSEAKALMESAKALLASGDTLGSVVAALRATRVKNSGFSLGSTRDEHPEVLRQVLMSNQEVNRLVEPEGGIFGLDFFPDGKKIITASEGCTLKTWSSSGELLNVRKNHKDSIGDVDVSADGTRVASLSLDGLLLIWDEQGNIVHREQNQSGGYFQELRFSPNSQYLINENHDASSVELRDRNGKLLRRFKFSNDSNDKLSSITFNVSSNEIIAASEKGIIKRWLLDGRLIQSFQAHDDAIKDIEVDPSGKHIFSASLDQSIKMWDLQGQLVQEFKEAQIPFWSLAISPDGQLIAAGTGGESVLIWHRSGALVNRLDSQSDRIWDLKFSPDGRYLATGGSEGIARIWNLAMNFRHDFYGHQAPVISINNNPERKEFITASDDQTMKLWNSQGHLIRTFNKKDGSVLGVDMSPSGNRIVSGGWNALLHLWTRNGQHLKTMQDHEGPVWRVKYSPNGQIVASASLDHSVGLWTDQGELIRLLKGHSSGVRDVAFSSDGQYLVSASLDKTAIIWDLASHTIVKTLKGHTKSLLAVAYHPQGNLIATAGFDLKIKLWTPEGELVATLAGHEIDIRGLNFSPDGSILASSSGDRTVKIWDIKNKKLLTTLYGYTRPVWDVAFINQGQKLVTVTEAGSGIIWELETLVSTDRLVQMSCAQLAGYFKYSANISGADRTLCLEAVGAK